MDDSGHGTQLGQVAVLWLLQDCLGTSVGVVNSVALDLPVICQVGATLLLSWLEFGSHSGQKVLNLVRNDPY